MKSPTKQLTELAGKVLWLASYPKSGNTWFRSFLSALLTGVVDINNMNTNGIFSGRVLVDKVLDIDSRLLTNKEAKNRIPEVYRFHAKNSRRLLFVKAHDAYHLNSRGEPIFPADVTHKAVYLVRNPLDVVGSFANHSNASIDRTIRIMNNKEAYLAKQKENLNINSQFPQLMYDWSGHVKSWINQDKIPTIVLKYEDSKKDPESAFSKVLKELDLKIRKRDLKAAIKMTTFEKLKKAESDKGFREKSATSPSFFRKGTTGGWKNELTRQQAQLIVDHHGEVMELLGYPTDLDC